MNLRRFLGAGLLLAFLAPLFVSPLAPGTGRRTVAGAACCAAMACCSAKGSCRTGVCDGRPPTAPATGGMTGPASKSHEPSLAAACPGPAPATGAEDRDPMHAPPSVALPTDAAIEGFIAVRPPVLASRERAPSVPPPRA